MKNTWCQLSRFTSTKKSVSKVLHCMASPKTHPLFTFHKSPKKFTSTTFTNLSHWLKGLRTSLLASPSEGRIGSERAGSSLRTNKRQTMPLRNLKTMKLQEKSSSSWRHVSESAKPKSSQITQNPAFHKIYQTWLKSHPNSTTKPKFMKKTLFTNTSSNPNATSSTFSWRICEKSISLTTLKEFFTTVSGRSPSNREWQCC